MDNIKNDAYFSGKLITDMKRINQSKFSVW